MFKFLLFLSVSICTSLSASQAIVDEANQAFENANELAMSNPSQAQEIYEKVIVQYRYLLEIEKIQTSGLHKNLANAYWFSGDKGRAILHYQRGLHLAPDNSDLIHDLKYARSQVTDEIAESTSQIVISYLMFWHHWPVLVRLALLFIMNSVFFGACALLLSRHCRILKGVRIASALLALVFGLSLLGNLAGWDNKTDGVVIATEVTSRQGNGHIYEPALNTPLHSGTEFTLLEARGEWCHIELSDGATCWLPVSDLALVRD